MSNLLKQQVMKANFEKMDVPFIVAHIVKNALEVASPRDNELRFAVKGDEDYEPIYINAEELQEIKVFLRDIFGPDTQGRY